MKLMLNRYPYLCPALEDSTGEKNGSYVFTSSWIGVPIDAEILEDKGRFWLAKISTFCEGKPGWLKLELCKECFDVLDP